MNTMIQKMLGIHQVDVEEQVADEEISLEGCAVCEHIKTMFVGSFFGLVAMWDDTSKEISFLGHQIYKKVAA